MNKENFLQLNLFGEKPQVEEKKKKRNVLSNIEKEKRKEKSDAHRAWKLLKSRKFKENLDERQKFLLKKYYEIEL